MTALCEELGVHTRPAKLCGVWIVPLLSWCVHGVCVRAWRACVRACVVCVRACVRLL